MTNDFEKVFDTAAEPQDYTGEDGLLYCGSCRTPKEAYFPADKAALFGRDRHPAECDCQRAKRLEREAAEQRIHEVFEHVPLQKQENNTHDDPRHDETVRDHIPLQIRECSGEQQARQQNVFKGLERNIIF